MEVYGRCYCGKQLTAEHVCAAETNQISENPCACPEYCAYHGRQRFEDMRDEIHQLRQREIECRKLFGPHSTLPNAIKWHEKLLVDLTRLRETEAKLKWALKDIAEDPVAFCSCCERKSKFAREALEECSQ